MKRILCYGDSNTWGFMGESGERFDEQTRWPCLLEQLTTLCRMDSIDVKPIIFDTRNQMECPASFPWERSEEMLMDYYFIVCLKCTAEC